MPTEFSKMPTLKVHYAGLVLLSQIFIMSYCENSVIYSYYFMSSLNTKRKLIRSISRLIDIWHILWVKENFLLI